MVNVKEISSILADLTVLKFFPTEPRARAGITRIVCEMVDPSNRVSPEDQARWLVARIITLFNEWPGPKEMRAVFCSRFRPADGIEALPDMEKYPEGLPSDPALPPLLPPPPARQIKRGEPVTKDAELGAGFGALLKSTEMPSARLSYEERQKERNFSRLLEATITAPGDRKDLPAPAPPKSTRITQADIDATVARRKSS